jgi:hypothetical protein
MVAAAQEFFETYDKTGAHGYFSICYHQLATFLGHERPALLLQRIHYWLQNEHSGYLLKDGTKWIFNGYKKFQEQFPWLSLDKIGACIRLLEKIGWLISARFHELKRNIGFVTPCDAFQEDNQKKWYRLDYQKIFDDTGVDMLFGDREAPPPPVRQKRHARANRGNSRLDSGSRQEAICETPESSIKENPNSTKLLSHSARENLDLAKGEDNTTFLPEVNWDEVISQTNDWETQVLEQELKQDNKNSNEDKYSAAAPVVIKQKRTRQERGNSSMWGFESQEERNGFYQALLELAKYKSGVKSPAGWAGSIIKSVNAGEPCEYLNEYRRGDVVGMCDIKEWEAKPGFPYPNFISYLKRKFEASHMTQEQATEATFKALRDVNEARTLWEGYKRYLANLKDEWEKQESLGVSNAYIPAEMLPEREVTIEEAAEAIQILQSNCVQTKELAAAPVYELAPALVTLPEAPELVAPETSTDRNQAMKAQVEQMREHLKSGKALKVSLARMWVRNNLDVVEPLLDDSGQIVDFFEKSDEGFLLEEPHPIPGSESKDVGASQLANNDDFWAEDTPSVDLICQLNSCDTWGQVLEFKARVGEKTYQAMWDRLEDDERERLERLEVDEKAQEYKDVPVPAQLEEELFRVGDRVFVESCPHTDSAGPYLIERIQGDMAKVENFGQLQPFSNLRLAQ